MRGPGKPVLIGAIAVLALVALGGAGYAWWSADLRYRPKTLTHQAEIAALIDNSGWVSPGLSNQKVLYMVSWRACPPCLAFERENFARLHAAGVDTRLIMYARRERSTAPERATVAELWKNRNWPLWERWTAAPVAAWTAEGIPPDTDPDRHALVEKSQAFVDRMRVLMADNGIGTTKHLNLPTLIWRGPDGKLRGCGCEKAETHKYVLKELGAI